MTSIIPSSSCKGHAWWQGASLWSHVHQDKAMATALLKHESISRCRERGSRASSLGSSLKQDTAMLSKSERSRLLFGTTSKVQNPARFGLGSGWCPLGGVWCVWQCWVRPRGVTQPAASAQDEVSSLHAALVLVFHPAEQGPFAPFQTAAELSVTAEFRNAVLSWSFSCCRCSVQCQWRKTLCAVGSSMKCSRAIKKAKCDAAAGLGGQDSLAATFVQQMAAHWSPPPPRAKRWPAVFSQSEVGGQGRPKNIGNHYTGMSNRSSHHFSCFILSRNQACVSLQ